MYVFNNWLYMDKNNEQDKVHITCDILQHFITIGLEGYLTLGFYLYSTQTYLEKELSKRQYILT